MSREEIVKLMNDINELTFRCGQIMAYKDMISYLGDSRGVVYAKKQIDELNKGIDEYERKYERGSD